MVANGDVGFLDVLPAGGSLRSPYYMYVRESLGLPVDHLFKIVDPRHPEEPLLLDLSGSVNVMGAHREDERPVGDHHDQCGVWLLRCAAYTQEAHEDVPVRKATLTLGWVDQEFAYYWGTNNRMVFLLPREGFKQLPDQSRLVVPFGEFLQLCSWTEAASAKAQHYRNEFDAGLVPSFEEAEALLKFPPSEVYMGFIVLTTPGVV